MQVLIGFANKVDDDHPLDQWTRLYRAHGATWLGIDTDDAVDICSDECLKVYTARWLQTDDDQYVGTPRYGCLPTLDVVRDDEPVDAPHHCDVCHELIDLPLTTYGEDYVAESVEEALRNPTNVGGNLDVIASWADAYPEARWAFADRTYYRSVAYGYVHAALWTTRGFHATEPTPDEDLLDFVWAQVREIAGLDPELVGHLFWRSRNGKDSGFVDYGLPAAQTAAEAFGPRELVEDEDGELVFE